MTSGKRHIIPPPEARKTKPRRLHAGYSSMLWRTLTGVGIVPRFIVRPESMTAYATIAAAFAAFLAVKAAERQEKATFTSALFSKQVDVLATSLTAVSEYLNCVSVYSTPNRVSGAEFEKVFIAEEKLLNALDALRILYPRDAQPFFRGLRNKEKNIGVSIEHMNDIPLRVRQVHELFWT
jgi:hypothetical protein